MKAKFILRSCHKGFDPKTNTISEAKEYTYSVQICGQTYKGKHFETSFGLFSTFAKNAKQAKENINQRLISLEAFDWALDGVDIFNR